MEDEKIIALFWKRSESAITHLEQKYGSFCFSIARRVLNNTQDSQECVNDTYLAVWEQIPPTRPKSLPAFLGRITRNISITRWRSLTAQRRGGGEMDVALEELAECVAGPWDVAKELERKELEQAIRNFCRNLSPADRVIFVRRYFFLNTTTEISQETGYTHSKVKSSLVRSRNKLKKQLEKEGLYEAH